MAKLNFDATGVAPDEGRGDPIPAGWYNVAITESENKPTAGGVDSSYLQCVFSVLDGQHTKRKLYHRFNLKNANAQAQEIAYKQLSAVMHAVGHLQCGDSTELHGRPLKVKVKIKPAEGQYEASNEITAFKNINEQVGTAAVGPAAAAAPFTPPPPAASWAPPAAPAGWAPPAAPQAPAGWAPPAAPSGPPPGWTPPAAAPAGPPPGWAPPAPPVAPPAAPPAWQPPPGAPAQPWAAPPAAPPAAAAPQAPVPAAGPPAWSPPAPPAGAVPPWMTQPPAA